MGWSWLWLAALLVSAATTLPLQEQETSAPSAGYSNAALLARELANEVSRAVAEAARQRESLKTEKDGDSDKMAASEIMILDAQRPENDAVLSQPKTHSPDNSTPHQPSSTNPHNGTTICLSKEEMKTLCFQRSTTAVEPSIKETDAIESPKTTKCITHATVTTEPFIQQSDASAILESTKFTSRATIATEPLIPQSDATVTSKSTKSTTRATTTEPLIQQSDATVMAKSTKSTTRATTTEPLIQQSDATVIAKSTVSTTHAAITTESLIQRSNDAETTQTIKSSTHRTPFADTTSLPHQKTTSCAKGTKYIAHIFIASSPFTRCDRLSATTPSHREDAGLAIDKGDDDRKMSTKRVRRQDDEGDDAERRSTGEAEELQVTQEAPGN